MELEDNERDGCRWQVARRLPAPALRPLLGQALEGWAWEGRSAASFHELPFPGIPLILNLATPWQVEGTNLDSFLAGLHTRPTTVAGERAFSCVELRLTPLGTRRLLGLPLHEVTDRSVPLEELLPGAETLAARLRDVPDWDARFDLVESFLTDGWRTRLRHLASSSGRGGSWCEAAAGCAFVRSPASSAGAHAA